MPLPTDPLLANQWHLIQPVPGLLDLNVLGVWNPAEGPSYSGLGTRTLVIDNGFDYTHPDFTNYDQFLDYDFEFNTPEPFGDLAEEHGTAVAGIIGAAANGTGAVGVAFDTSLVGYRTVNLINDDWLLDIIEAIFSAANNAAADVVNSSQGIANDLNSEFGNGYNAVRFNEIEASIASAVDDGRGGLGMTIVKEAGNSRASDYDINADDWTNDTRQVVVAGVDQDGFVSSDSSYGAALLVSAFGTPGEVFTTDRVGAAGSDATDFTRTFNGTSAAAPMVAGVVSLMYEANAGLGWRDVQSILAVSARHVGSELGAGITGSERHAWEWNGSSTWNGGGMHFSNDYGYGLVDALAAVRLAETWLLTGASAQTSSNQFSNTRDVLDVSTIIPEANATGLSFTGNLTFDDIVERVTVEMAFSTPFIADLKVYITSPDGTTSILIESAGGSNAYNGTWTFESQAFRGERAAGNWTVRVVDDSVFDTLTVSDIVIRAFGAPTADDRYIFTNELSDYAGIFGHATAISDANGGINDTANAAAVTSASVIRLDGLLGTIDGVGIALTNIENAIGGDGGDQIYGSIQGNQLFGMRGADALYGGDNSDFLYGGTNNDTLHGGLGVDTLVGGVGNDLYFVDNLLDIVTEGLGEGTSDRVAASVTWVLGVVNYIEQITTTMSAGTTAIDLRGNAFAQSIFGNAGNNVLNDGGAGAADTLTGGLGNDTLIVNNAGSIVVEGAGGGTDDRVAASVSFVLNADDHIERLTTSSSASTAAINLTGNAFSQQITGNAGANVLSTGTGAADVMTGLGGNDTYRVYNALDQIVEAAGQGTADRVTAAVSFVLNANDNIEVMTTNGSTGTAAINLTGNALAQAVTGNAGVNVLSDGGGAGADTLTGLAGNDTYIVRNAGTLIVEGTGRGTADRVAAGVSFALAADDNIEVLTTNSSAGTAAINLTGNALAQAVTGNAGANVLNGLGGLDTLTGGGGADAFVFSTALGAGNIDTMTDFNVAADTIRLENAIFTGLVAGVLTAAAFRANLTGLAADASDRIIHETDTGTLFFDADGLGGAAGLRFAVLDPGMAVTQTDFLVI